MISHFICSSALQHDKFFLIFLNFLFCEAFGQCTQITLESLILLVVLANETFKRRIMRSLIVIQMLHAKHCI